MNPAQLSIALLAVLFLTISVCWIAITLKEGRKALDDCQKQ